MFLGAISQFRKWNPDITASSTELRKLLTKGTVFSWGDQEEKEFKNLKEIVAKSKWVTPFDVNLKTKLLVDSLKLGGIGYILLQETGETLPGGEPKMNMVKCNSIAPKSSWRGYSPLEMELMGLYWAPSNCSYYILGSQRPITVITDHKPLVGTFSKPLFENTARILKLRLELMQFNLDVVWEAWKMHPVCRHAVQGSWLQGMDMILPNT